MQTLHGTRRVVAILAAALLAGAVVYAAIISLSPNRIDDADAAGAALRPTPTSTSTSTLSTPSPTTPIPTTMATPLVTAAPATLPAATETEAPTAVSIPVIEARLSVIPTGVTTEGEMEIPDDPRVAGWYRFGPGPNTESGATVMAAHIDSRERVGPLARLAQVTPGDEIIVTTDDQEVRYVIERVDSYPKTVIDLDAVFDRGGPPRLHLVTCGGEWDSAARSYEDNIVAVAVRADVS